jgi:hypothetical protein
LAARSATNSIHSTGVAVNLRAPMMMTATWIKRKAPVSQLDVIKEPITQRIVLEGKLFAIDFLLDWMVVHRPLL